MAMLPRMYKASTRAKAEQALANGALYYPAFCYIASENIMAWVDAHNIINYIESDRQITNVTYESGYLSFLSGDRVIESVSIAMSEDDAQRIIEQMTTQLNLDEYSKKAEVATMLDNRVGDLEGADSVVDYISMLSYNRLVDAPITNLKGTLTKAVVLSALKEGVYRITGPYLVGGKNETVYHAIVPTIALVSHDSGDSKITVITSTDMRLFYLTPQGVCSSDKYVTENYLIANYTKTLDIVQYITDTVGKVAPSIIEQAMETKLDAMLSERIEAIPLTDVFELF